MKILHFPTLIGANPPALAAEERRLGHESVCIADVPSPFSVECDQVLMPEGGSLLRRSVARWRTSRDLMRTGRFDVVHFNGGQTAFNRYGFAIDVPAWKRRGTRIVVTFQGTDARPMRALRSPQKHPADAIRDWTKRVHVHRLARLADAAFVLNPDLLDHVPGSEFVPYASIDHRQHRVSEGSDSNRLRIVHAPSKRWVKGTDFVLSARSELGDAEYDWQLLESLTRAEVGQELDQADIAIDQFRIGWYGAFSLEAMARGIPTICWIEPRQLARVPAEFRNALPLVSCTGQDLAETIASLRRDSEYRAEISARSREFAVRFHDPRSIARALTEVYAGTRADFWSAWNDLGSD